MDVEHDPTLWDRLIYALFGHGLKKAQFVNCMH
jgi:hypothetical protein